MAEKIEFRTLADNSIEGLVNQINARVRANKELDIDVQSVVVTLQHEDGTPRIVTAIIKTYSKEK